MKKRMLSIVLCLMTLYSLLPAQAEPVVSGQAGYTACIGENNYLYLTDPDGVTKVMQTSIADLAGMDDVFLYCSTADGRLYEVRLDGTSSRVLDQAPALTPAYILEENILTPNSVSGVPLSGIANVAAACTAGDMLYYVTSNPDGTCTLMGVSLPIADGTVPAPVRIMHPVSKPRSMTATSEAVVIVTESGTVEIIGRTPLAGMATLTLENPLATHAYLFNGKLVSLSQGENGQYTVLSSADYVLPALAVTVTAVPTAQPTATAKPTATPKPAATAKPTAASKEDDGRISKGDTGSAVRKMQRRLEKLGYPVGTVDGDFGDNTLLAVNLFQCAIGYRNRTYASAKMLDKLYASDAPAYDPYAPLKEGDEGADVKILQQTLIDLDYTVGEKGADGIFGQDTKAAVEQFQFVAGLEVTGEADVETLKKLYDIENPVPNATRTPEPAATPEPTVKPTEQPTEKPTEQPTEKPTQAPTEKPTAEPTEKPTQAPTAAPDSGIATPTDLE